MLCPHCIGEVKVTAQVTDALNVEQNADPGLSDETVCNRTTEFPFRSIRTV